MSDPIRTLFAAHGLRCTRHRRSIYDALAATNAHPTVDELYQRLGGAMSLATVYSTLECFCDAGLVRKLPGVAENGSARYDAVTEPHVHACDTATGRIVDVPEHLSKRIIDHVIQDQLATIEKKLGFRVRDVRIKLLGEFDE